MNLSIDIQPAPTTKPAVKAFVQYVNVSFVEPEYATVRICLADEDASIVGAYDVPLTLAEANEWGEDDTYVLNLALQKLGITV